MKKSLELNDPNSCLNKAKDNELLFVLLERDDVAAETIRFWAYLRIAHAKNRADDPQIKEALALANAMHAGYMIRHTK